MQDRVWYARELAPYGDKWLRDEVLDHEDMASLRGRTLGPVLLEGETLPSTLEDVFVDFEGAIKDVWRPNDEVGPTVLTDSNTTWRLYTMNRAEHSLGCSWQN